jgi:hypothetical protein
MECQHCHAKVICNQICPCTGTSAESAAVPNGSATSAATPSSNPAAPPAAPAHHEQPEFEGMPALAVAPAAPAVTCTVSSGSSSEERAWVTVCDGVSPPVCAALFAARAQGLVQGGGAPGGSGAAGGEEGKGSEGSSAGST